MKPLRTHSGAPTLLLTVPQTAADLQISTASVYRLFEAGLPFVQIGVSGSKRRVERSALLEFIQERTTTMT